MPIDDGNLHRERERQLVVVRERERIAIMLGSKGGGFVVEYIPAVIPRPVMK